MFEKYVQAHIQLWWRKPLIGIWFLKYRVDQKLPPPQLYLASEAIWFVFWFSEEAFWFVPNPCHQSMCRKMYRKMFWTMASFFKICIVGIGRVLSKPHTSRTALHTCVAWSTCLWPLTVNSKLNLAMTVLQQLEHNVGVIDCGSVDRETVCGVSYLQIQIISAQTSEVWLVAYCKSTQKLDGDKVFEWDYILY